jgi:hypothetical protein
MLNLDEINKEILELEKHDTTYAVCERLAWLLIVRDYLTDKSTAVAQAEPLSVEDKSEFLKAVNGKESSCVWEIVDELMETLKVVNPRVYQNVLSKIEKI